jgi:hypothetical protein
MAPFLAIFWKKKKKYGQKMRFFVQKNDQFWAQNNAILVKKGCFLSLRPGRRLVIIISQGRRFWPQARILGL